VPILDLGNQSLTGIFPKSSQVDVPKGPLQLTKCAHCDLVQLAHNFDLSQLYGQNYGYRSGLNQSMVKHLQGKVAKILGRVEVAADDLIIDIGSNDSTLLQSYPKDKGLKLVGIDPTGVKFGHYYPSHIQLIPDFFSRENVKKAFGNKKAKIITSIAMFYDLEHPVQFMREIFESLDDEGVWVFEQSYMPFMLDTTSYDTVCHEHLEYYGLKQMKFMADQVGFKIVDIEFNDVNGGSFSLTVAKKSSRFPEATAEIAKVLGDEQKRGLSGLDVFKDFKDRTFRHRDQLKEFFSGAAKEGASVFGYGASTKGNVLLQFCELTTEELPWIAEVNEDKFGSFTPGTKIPIISESEAKKRNPTYFMVLPWHFKSGILSREKTYLSTGGKLLFPLPKLEVISSSTQ
jgi:hypothetical protein